MKAPSPHKLRTSEARRIAIVGGGTAGHVYPALALADAYRKDRPNLDLHFIGTPAGFEARLIPGHGYPLHLIQGSPLFGVTLAGKARALKQLSVGIAQARRLLKENGTQMVIGFGGYASGGVMLAARSLGLKTAIHEANVVPGLTNRWLGRVVDRVYLGFAKSRWAFPKSKTLVTGNPVRPEIVNVGLQRSPNPHAPVRILVTGGSQGSDFLNRNVPELLGWLSTRGISLEVRHQAGRFDPNPIRAAYRKARLVASVVPYIDNMAGAYRWADFAVVCSGSLTVTELSASRLPALLVPLSGSAGDHQAANAVAFAETGAGLWIREEDWNPDLLAANVAGLLVNADRWMKACRSADRLSVPGAARQVVADCEAAMRGDC